MMSGSALCLPWRMIDRFQTLLRRACTQALSHSRVTPKLKASHLQVLAISRSHYTGVCNTYPIGARTTLENLGEHTEQARACCWVYSMRTPPHVSQLVQHSLMCRRQSLHFCRQATRCDIVCVSSRH